ncbi:MAG TPA: peptidase M14, partial [Polyangia bacterium]|nr:peptidase M14 [Polyangia bacterium]
FVPVFNVDGHERFGPQQRPNQRGPQESGYRRTAQELNLNRDWTKAEAPEMAAMLALVKEWDPALMVDLHVTDGAKFEQDVAVLISPDTPTPRALTAAGRALGATVFARLRAQGHLPLDFYPAFRSEDDPASGIDASPPPPRFSNAYFAARNRLGMLVETHSWRPYQHRVKTTRVILQALVEAAVTQAASWREAGQATDAEGERLGGTDVALMYKATDVARTVDFRGYAYKREPSAISGTTWVEYDERRPQVWKVSVYDQLTPALLVRAPRAGYVVPAAHAAWVARKLDLHGIQYRALPKAARLPALAFRADEAKFAATPFEGRQPLKLAGKWRAETRDVPAGSLFVPIAQPRARLAMHLLEPTAPDSLAAWGFFQTAFEEKEGMETYVVEAEARKMLARDGKLRAQFEGLLRDPAFAKDPAKRLDFFRRRHPSWNEGFNLYPVLGLDRAPD